jgi:hypothetical protein
LADAGGKMKTVRELEAEIEQLKETAGMYCMAVNIVHKNIDRLLCAIFNDHGERRKEIGSDMEAIEEAIQGVDKLRELRLPD